MIHSDSYLTGDVDDQLDPIEVLLESQSSSDQPHDDIRDELWLPDEDIQYERVRPEDFPYKIGIDPVNRTATSEISIVKKDITEFLKKLHTSRLEGGAGIPHADSKEGLGYFAILDFFFGDSSQWMHELRKRIRIGLDFLGKEILGWPFLW